MSNPGESVREQLRRESTERAISIIRQREEQRQQTSEALGKLLREKQSKKRQYWK